MKVVVYTDGSCRNSVGGYAFIIITDDYELEWADHAINTTNNRMELTAVIEALRCIPLFSEITIYSDSQWVINCAKKTWKRNKNLDLWKLYDALEPNYSISYIWVKGHSGDFYNERCDKLAYNELNKNIITK
jgi:ribonuclease HI